MKNNTEISVKYQVPNGINDLPTKAPIIGSPVTQFVKLSKNVQFSFKSPQGIKAKIIRTKVSMKIIKTPFCLPVGAGASSSTAHFSLSDSI